MNENGYKIIPYVASGEGEYSIPIEIMTGIFFRAKEANIIRRTFTDGRVKDIGEWMVFIRNANNVIHTVWDDNTCIAVGWLNDFGINYATAHFFMFKEAYGKSSCVGKLSLDYWFMFRRKGSEEPLLDTIVGQTPENNKLALKFIERIGFRRIGVIPSAAYDAYTGEKHGMVISYKENENG